MPLSQNTLIAPTRSVSRKVSAFCAQRTARDVPDWYRPRAVYSLFVPPERERECALARVPSSVLAGRTARNPMLLFEQMSGSFHFSDGFSGGTGTPHRLLCAFKTRRARAITLANAFHPYFDFVSSRLPAASRSSTSSGILPSACVAQERHGS